MRLQQRKKMLGTDVYLTIRPNNVKQGEKVFELLWKRITEFDQKFSRFIATSELTRLNAKAGTKVKVSQEFIHFLIKSLEMVKESNGLFNPLMLPALQRAGYLGSWPKAEEEIPGTNFSLRSVTDVNKIEIGKDWALLPQNSAVDSGGIGKGYLLDQLSEIVEKNNISDYWFSLGGDLICAGNDEGKTGWLISVESVLSDSNAQDFIPTNGKKIAVATSGILKRRGKWNNKEWHHIIDPRTGEPAKTDILTATVVSKTATLADIYAKSLVILGSSDGRTFIKKKKLPLTILQTTKGKMPLKIYWKDNHG